MRRLLLLSLILFTHQAYAQEEGSSAKIVAPIASAIVGFGSGHLVKGTYLESGWKFTLLDTGTAFLALGSVACDIDCPSLGASLLLLASVRVWETLDCIHSDKQGSIGLVPTGARGRYSLIYSYKF